MSKCLFNSVQFSQDIQFSDKGLDRQKVWFSVPGVPYTIRIDCKGGLTLGSNLISNTNRKTQKRHKDKLPQEVQKKEVCFCKLKQTTKQSLGAIIKREGLLGQASCSPQASKGCRRSWPHAAPPSPSSDLSCGQRCEKLVKHKKWNLVVEACAIMFPPIGFLGSAW